MKSERTLPSSKKPSTETYLETDETFHTVEKYFSTLHFNIILIYA